jgi:hypothetical protein
MPIGDLGRGAGDGGVFIGSRSPAAGIRVGRSGHSGGLTAAPAAEKPIQDYTARRLPGLAGGRLGNGEQSLEAPSDCFETGREHKLNLL